MIMRMGRWEKKTEMWAITAGCLLFGAGLFTAASAMAAPSATPQDMLYSDATVIDGTGALPRPHQDILVHGQRIVAIAPHGTILAAAAAHSIDVSNRFIIPGLIDSHVHLETPPNNPQARAVLRRDLYGGVTAVRDMADDLRPVAELTREALAGEIAAPDIYYAAFVAGPSFFKDPRIIATNLGMTPGRSPWMQAITRNTNIPEAITLARGTSATGLKIYADLAPDLVDKLTREAHRQHLLVWAHGVVFPTSPAQVIASGVDVVSHVCYLGFQHDTVIPALYEDHARVNETLFAKEGDDPLMGSLLREMKRRGQILDATGRVFVGTDAARVADPTVPMPRCSGALVTRLTRQAWRTGVAISTGTDGIARYDHDWPEVDDELLFLARDVGMQPLQVLHSATLVGAAAAGQERDMGSLEVGKLANFVILRSDPSVDIRNIRSVEATVKRGRVYSRADYQPSAKAEIVDSGFPVSPEKDWTVR